MSPRLLPLVALFATTASLAAQPTAEPPYVPTPHEVVEAMLELARVGTHDVLFDLGSGDGRIPIAAARRHGTRGVGFEHQPALVALSRARADSAGVGHLVSFHAGDLFTADLRPATVLALYLSGPFNLRLRPTILRQLRPGARVVSHTFHMGEWAPDSTVHLGSGVARTTLHLWVVPAYIDGFWSLRMEGSPELALEFEQAFQRARGTARTASREIPLSPVRLDGDRIEFSVPLGRRGGDLRFSGRVEGGWMGGTYHRSGRSGRWEALRFDHPRLAPLTPP